MTGSPSASSEPGAPEDEPWDHRWVSANGARFHVATCGSADDPLVLFLHGFPEFWWAWRYQLPVLAANGFRAAAMDLRGYGQSDKTPRGYDPMTLAADVAGLVRSLGHSDAVLVGHGIGGYVAWATAALHPQQVRALAVVSAPHPGRLQRLLFRSAPAPIKDGARPRRSRARGQPRSVLHVLSFQVPIVPERRLVARHGALVEELLRRWSAPGSSFPSPEAGRRYREAMLQWPAPHCALEYYRWLFRSAYRSDGRRFARRMRDPVRRPVLQLHGALDPVVPRTVAEGSAELVSGPYRWRILDEVGHFPHEEQPDAFNKELLAWLDLGFRD